MSLQMSSDACGQAQTPSWHCVPPIQWLSQPPQLLLSDWVSTHTPSQASPPFGQVQTPPWQVCSISQTTPQPPQLSGSDCVSTHASPQHVLPSSVLQQPLPQATSPAKAVQHWPASLHVPALHCLSL